MEIRHCINIDAALTASAVQCGDASTSERTLKRLEGWLPHNIQGMGELRFFWMNSTLTFPFEIVVVLLMPHLLVCVCSV